MKLEYKNTVLIVKDIERSKKFYIDILNQEIEFDFGSNIGFKSGLSIWELRDYLPITKKLGPDRLKKNHTTKFELYLETDNLEELETRLSNYGVQFLHRIHEEPWGQRTLRFFDMDDHLIEIGEPIEVFVKRFHKNGMTPEEIAEKTSIAKNIVITILKKTN